MTDSLCRKRKLAESIIPCEETVYNFSETKQKQSYDKPKNDDDNNNNNNNNNNKEKTDLLKEFMNYPAHNNTRQQLVCSSLTLFSTLIFISIKQSIILTPWYRSNGRVQLSACPNIYCKRDLLGESRVTSDSGLFRTVTLFSLYVNYLELKQK